MSKSNLARLVSVPVAAVLVTAGCNGGDPEPTGPEPTITVTPEPTVTPTPTESPSPGNDSTDDDSPNDDAPFSGDTASDTADPSEGARLSPVDIRWGVHIGFDRVVVDLEGEGMPGWFVEYDDDPRTAGKGDPVQIAGDSTLTLHVRGVMYPTEEGGTEFRGQERHHIEAGGVIEEIRFGTIFEGQADVYIGVSSEQPFRVFVLEEPTRVVIDVQHP